MAADGWKTLMARLPEEMYERIRADAAADDRSITKWLELHFRDHYRAKDSQCEPPTSSSPVSSSSSATPS
jgi:hypothetical protein